ncbi:hypothetical protein OC834_007886, partial [Tilletia horrida]
RRHANGTRRGRAARQVQAAPRSRPRCAHLRHLQGCRRPDASARTLSAGFPRSLLLHAGKGVGAEQGYGAPQDRCR